jgi:hypothetical protein
MRECGETNCELAKCPFGVNLGIKCPCDSYTDRRTDGPSCYSEGPGLETWDLLHCAFCQHVATTVQLVQLSPVHIFLSLSPRELSDRNRSIPFLIASGYRRPSQYRQATDVASRILQLQTHWIGVSFGLGRALHRTTIVRLNAELRSGSPAQFGTQYVLVCTVAIHRNLIGRSMTAVAPVSSPSSILPQASSRAFFWQGRIRRVSKTLCDFSYFFSKSRISQDLNQGLSVPETHGGGSFV